MHGCRGDAVRVGRNAQPRGGERLSFAAIAHRLNAEGHPDRQAVGAGNGAADRPARPGRVTASGCKFGPPASLARFAEGGSYENPCGQGLEKNSGAKIRTPDLLIDES